MLVVLVANIRLMIDIDENTSLQQLSERYLKMKNVFEFSYHL
jgi:hypothetical protein